ncbi:hypothetical protein ES319_D10G063900v1 [Gossypium barbadense]|uniref:Mediator of RNA polymerase II transcription subunit 9 n=2 Tax=Gossypium TaxID=3633 RepID=A0A5J5PMB2_GOSBA|nr:hypothetical protein ES319_D10G063900v1 [Gossypium barbadense]TYG49081.1 hypothetical protein ES288_D10G066400v1 [Gossypium darwinii]
MDPSAGGGSCTTIPSVPPHSNSQQQQVQQDQHHQSLPSHFHLLHLVENLGDAIDNGTRDQHSDDLINELNNHFEKCQQLLNSIGASINTKPMTVEGQKQKLEESEQLLNQRRDLIANCRSSVEDLVKTEP